MQGDKIAETSVKFTSKRVLPNPGGGPKMESSFAASGKLLGVDETETGTYSAAVRPDGTLYGEGQGIIMGKEGDVATWVGQGVGTIKKGGAVSYRGAVYYQSSSSRWRSEEHTSELQSQSNLVCRLLLEKKKKRKLHRR